MWERVGRAVWLVVSRVMVSCTVKHDDDDDDDTGNFSKFTGKLLENYWKTTGKLLENCWKTAGKLLENYWKTTGILISYLTGHPVLQP